MAASWADEVWNVCKSQAEAWAQMDPAGWFEIREESGGSKPKRQKFWTPLAQAQKQKFQNEGIVTGVMFNLAWLNPTAQIIEYDSIALPRLISAGKYYFCQKDGVPCAPAEWPTGKTIPLAVCDKTFPVGKTAGTDYQQYGHAHIIQGFWWAVAKAIQMVGDPAGAERLKKFQSLVVKASVDMKTVSALTLVPQLGFQMIQDNEELRANYGFTGARVMLLVKWAFKEAKAARQDKKDPTAAEIHKVILEKITFRADDTSAPSLRMVADVMGLVREVLPNARAMKALQLCEDRFGREHPLDDYSKLIRICGQCGNSEEISFMFEWIAAALIQQVGRGGSASYPATARTPRKQNRPVWRPNRPGVFCYSSGRISPQTSRFGPAERGPTHRLQI